MNVFLSPGAGRCARPALTGRWQYSLREPVAQGCGLVLGQPPQSRAPAAFDEAHLRTLATTQGNALQRAGGAQLLQELEELRALFTPDHVESTVGYP